MKKLLTLLLFWLSICIQAQNSQSIAGQWTISKVIKIEGMSGTKLKQGKEALEGNVILTFNQDGTFHSTATKKTVTNWVYKRKTKTILLTGKSQKLKIQILKFKTTSMRVKMQLSKSVLGEFVLVKN